MKEYQPLFQLALGVCVLVGLACLLWQWRILKIPFGDYVMGDFDAQKISRRLSNRENQICDLLTIAGMISSACTFVLTALVIANS